MRPLFFLSILFLFFTSFAFAQKKMIILGDSLTDGYGVAKEAAFPALLEKKLNNWKVISAGVTGSTTASGLSRLKWLIKSKPDVLVLALGANDALRGFDPKNTVANLEETIAYAQSQKLKVILVGMKAPPNYGVDFQKKFEKIFLDLAKKFKVYLVPFLLEGVAGDMKLNQNDGIHPNEQGHKVIADYLYKKMKDHL